MTVDETKPYVTLAGKKWQIPELAIRQLREVRRPIIDLTEALIETKDASTGERVMRLSSEQYASMCEVVYWGLTRAYPELSHDEFLNLAVTDGEILLAFMTVRTQSGIYVKTEGASRGTPGEDAPSQIGTSIVS